MRAPAEVYRRAAGPSIIADDISILSIDITEKSARPRLPVKHSCWPSPGFTAATHEITHDVLLHRQRHFRDFMTGRAGRGRVSIIYGHLMTKPYEITAPSANTGPRPTFTADDASVRLCRSYDELDAGLP